MGQTDVCLLLSTEDSSNVKHVKADFAFYLLLAYDFDIICTILSSLSKNYMIKPEIKKKKMSGMNFWMGGVEWYWGCWQELGLRPTS